MLTYTPNNHKGKVMLPKFMKKNVTQNPLAVPYYKIFNYKDSRTVREINSMVHFHVP